MTLYEYLLKKTVFQHFISFWNFNYDVELICLFADIMYKYVKYIMHILIQL